jgi:hypothetical protein
VRSPSPGGGIGTRAAEEATEKAAPYRSDKAKAQEIHDRFFIGFDDGAAVPASENAARTWTQPWQGRNKKPLKGAEFYRALGRKDLANKYDSNQETKVAVTIIGVAAAAAGTWLAIASLQKPGDYNPGTGSGGSSASQGILGILVIGIGCAAAVVPWYFSSHPVDAPEARRLADEHNQKLKAKLGLSVDDEALPEGRTGDLRARLILSPTAFATSNGAVVGVAGRY